MLNELERIRKPSAEMVELGQAVVHFTHIVKCASLKQTPESLIQSLKNMPLETLDLIGAQEQSSALDKLDEPSIPLSTNTTGSSNLYMGAWTDILFYLR